MGQFKDKNPNKIPARELRIVARKEAARSIEVQKAEFKQFGIMADWSEGSTYRTYGKVTMAVSLSLGSFPR